MKFDERNQVVRVEKYFMTHIKPHILNAKLQIFFCQTNIITKLRK